jgi:PPOX class probable F420-dependent enzyme
MATALDAETYVNLETFRKDGSGVQTPVWAAPLDGKLVIVTDGTSYKVKRIKNDPKVRLAACSARGAVKGPWHDGTCRVLDAAAGERAEVALRSKYGLQYRALNFFSRISGRIARRAYLEVTVNGPSGAPATS